MKASRKHKSFKPVTITVETKDELNYLWHALNVCKASLKSNACTLATSPRFLTATRMKCGPL